MQYLLTYLSSRYLVHCRTKASRRCLHFFLSCATFNQFPPMCLISSVHLCWRSAAIVTSCIIPPQKRIRQIRQDIQCQGHTLDFASQPKYLGVTLDRIFSFKNHCQFTKMKVVTTYNILRKLTGSQWEILFAYILLDRHRWVCANKQQNMLGPHGTTTEIFRSIKSPLS